MADPKAAATNFLNALEKIPGIISQRKEKNEALTKDIPQLQELAGKVWKKVDERNFLHLTVRFSWSLPRPLP